MITKPIYSFNNDTQTGLDSVPLNSTICIENISGAPKYIVLIDKTGIDGTTTLSTLLTSTTLWKELIQPASEGTDGTDGTDGLMTDSDKYKLNNISSDADVTPTTVVLDDDFSPGTNGFLTKTADGVYSVDNNSYALISGSTSQNFNALDLTVQGNLTVQGTTTTLNTSNLIVQDKNIEIGYIDGASETDASADGGGITLYGDTNKTILWNNTTNSWDFNQSVFATNLSGTNTGDELPSQTGESGKVLSTDGTTVSWVLIDDGVADEATTLTGLTSSIAELNYLDNVTSDVQSQLNSLDNYIGWDLSVNGGTQSRISAVNDVDFQAGTAITLDLTSNVVTISSSDTTYTSGTGIDLTSGVFSIDSTVTTEGNTFNGASELVKLGGSAELPVIDGSNLTNITIDQLSDVDTSTVQEVNGDVLIWNTTKWENKSLSNAGIQSSLTFGIADGNIPDIDSGAAILLNDYAKFTSTGLIGQSYSEVKTDLSLNLVENTAISTWSGSSSLVTLGTVITGTWNADAITDSYISSSTIWNAKLDSNSITAGTNLKITYDTDGLITSGSTANISDLSDVNTTGVTTNQILKYNGTSWLPTNDSGIGEYIGNSISISADGTAIPNDDGTSNANIALGANAGLYVTTGTENIINGSNAGKGNTTDKVTGSYNIISGYYAANAITSGLNNIIQGRTAGQYLTTASNNIFLGNDAGAGDSGTAVTGSNNILLGQSSGKYISTGTHNINIGTSAGEGNSSNNVSANYNTIIGYYAGNSITSGSRNVLIGYQSGNTLTTESDKLHIGNNGTTSLIEGDFAAATPWAKVNGDLEVTGSFTESSAEKYKENIQPLHFSLDSILAMQGVSYNKIGEEKTEIGLIADEVNEIRPEYVLFKDGEIEGIAYQRIVADLIEAVKSQQEMITELQNRVSILEK